MTEPATAKDYESLALDTLSPRDRYKLLIGSVIPRPIAFVTTLHENGLVNAAPFSQFIIIAANPGLLGFSAGVERGRIKDTVINIRRTEEFVINTVPEELAEKVQLCADHEDPGDSEVDLAGLTAVPSERVAPPRIGESLIQFECKLERIVEFGSSPNALVVGRVVLMHARNGLIRDYKIDPAAVRMLGRIGGRNYCRVREFIAV